MFTKIYRFFLYLGLDDSGDLKNYLSSIYLFFINIDLRFIYILKTNTFIIPTRHLISLHVILSLQRIYSSFGINFFLLSGMLLGGVRQASFAGRPKDIDIGIIEKDFKIFKKKIFLIKNYFKNQLSSPIYEKPKFGIYYQKNNRIYFRIKTILVDIAIYKPVYIKKKKFWRINKPSFLFSYSDLLKLKKIKLYNIYFFIPKNFKKYLEHLYGRNWRIPDSKQFAWKNLKAKV